MTREELEQSIKNGESVWACRNDIVYKVALDSSWVYIENDILKWYSPVNKILGHKYYSINELYKTKAEAEHYLHHANITRTETLPFLTWEEFNKNTLGFDFADEIGNKYRCHIVRDYRDGEDFIVLYDKNGTISVDEEWEATEANFYKAYDECVRLFKGE